MTGFMAHCWSSDLDEWCLTTCARSLLQPLASRIRGIGQGLASHPWTASPAGSTLRSGAPGSLVGDVHDFRTRQPGAPMSIDSAQAGGSPDTSPAATALVSPAAPSWPWRRTALFLAGAAQLITISALVGADPVPRHLVIAAAGCRAGAAGGRGSLRAGASEPAGRGGRDRGPGRRHRDAGHPYRAVFRAGSGGAGRWGRQALARAVSSSGEGVSR